MRVLLSARHFDVPDLSPSFVQRLVYGIHAGVVRRYRVARVGGDAVLQSELLVQHHLSFQLGHVAVQVRLLMVPHVAKPV